MEKLLFDRFMNAELSFYLSNETGMKLIAEQYVGLSHVEI